LTLFSLTGKRDRQCPL